MFIVHLIWLWWLTQMQFKFKVGAFSFITFASLPSLTRITNPYLSSWVSNATTVDSVPTSVCILFVSLSLSFCMCIHYVYIYTVIYIHTLCLIVLSYIFVRSLLCFPCPILTCGDWCCTSFVRLHWWVHLLFVGIPEFVNELPPSCS